MNFKIRQTVILCICTDVWEAVCTVVVMQGHGVSEIRPGTTSRGSGASVALILGQVRVNSVML